MNQKNITIGALLISVIALAVAGYSLNALTTRTAPKPPTVLVYDVKMVTFVQDNVSMTTDITGNTFVVVGSIFPQGQVDKTAPVGKYTCLGTDSSSAGEDISVQVMDITGVGQIILNGLEPAGNATTTGAIVGGTGQYVGAQGTYTQHFDPSGVFLTNTLTITSTASG